MLFLSTVIEAYIIPGLPANNPEAYQNGLNNFFTKVNASCNSMLINPNAAQP